MQYKVIGKTHCNHCTGNHGQGQCCGQDGYFCGSKACGVDITKPIENTVVILNGPPSSGKDVAATHLAHHYTRTHNNVETVGAHLEFKQHLIALALKVTGICKSVWDTRYDDRSLKEVPWDRCGGLSQRQLLIKISEDWCKPLMGTEYFGERATTLIQKSKATHMFFSDGGFPDEINAIKESCDRLVIIRIHRDGCNYDNDSRNYIHLPDVETHDITNNGTLSEFFDKCRGIVDETF